MHTVLVVVVGLGVLGLCLLAGHMLGGVTRMMRAALAFLPLWPLGSGINLLIGVRSAGYSVADELPVFLVVFAVPSLVAAALWWRLH